MNNFRFLRRLQHSLAKARSQQDCISSRSDDDDENMDDSMPSDPWTPPIKPDATTVMTTSIDSDSPSANQSKSPESHSPPLSRPPNEIHMTKTTRSLSLNANQSGSSHMKFKRTDTYLDEANSD